MHGCIKAKKKEQTKMKQPHDDKTSVSECRHCGRKCGIIKERMCCARKGMFYGGCLRY